MCAACGLPEYALAEIDWEKEREFWSFQPPILPDPPAVENESWVRNEIDRFIVRRLEQEGHATAGLESKSWDHFSGADAPDIDVVITVCDNAAGETCPYWNGAPVTVHWGIPDPAADGDFNAAYDRLHKRVTAMVDLDSEGMDSEALRTALQAIHTD